MDKMIRDNDYLNVKKLVNMSIFISIAIGLSLFEAMLPITFIVPGVKLGLANIILLLLLDHYSFKELVLFQFIKITITTFILGLFSVYIFSLVGGYLALILMYSSKKIFGQKISIYSLSVIGAVGHNLGQLSFAIIYLKAVELIMYAPLLVVFGCISGIFIGMITNKIKLPIERKLNHDTLREFFSE